MKTIMITIMMMVGMIGFSQQNEKSMSTVQEGDSIIFKSMRCEFSTTSGEVYSFKGVAVVSNVYLYDDGSLLSIQITTANGEKYELYSDMLIYYAEKGKVEVISK